MDNQDVGRALEDIDIGDYMGTDKQTGFNIHYMIEAVSAMGGERILFEMSEDLKPAMFKPSNAPATDFWLYVLATLTKGVLYRVR